MYYAQICALLIAQGYNACLACPRFLFSFQPTKKEPKKLCNKKLRHGLTLILHRLNFVSLPLKAMEFACVSKNQRQNNLLKFQGELDRVALTSNPGTQEAEANRSL